MINLQFCKGRKYSRLASTQSAPTLAQNVQLPSNSSLKFSDGYIPLSSSKGFVGTGILRPRDWITHAQRTVSLVESIVRNLSRGLAPSKFVANIDRISHELCILGDSAELCRNVHANPDMVEAAENALAIIAQVINKLNADTQLYLAAKKAFESGTLSSEEEIALGGLIVEFEHNGVHLSLPEREKLFSLQEKLHALIADYMRTMKEDDFVGKLFIPKRHAKRFPVNLVKSAQDYKGEYLVYRKLTNRLANGLARSMDPVIRKAVFESEAADGKEYLKKLDEILYLRQEIATILGFESYVESSAWNRFLKSGDEIQSILHNIYASILPTARSEFREIMERKRIGEQPFIDDYPLDDSHSNPNLYYPWDVVFQSHEINLSHTCSYFSLGNCLDGLVRLCEHLFNIEIVIADVSLDEIYNEQNVFKLEVYDRDLDRLLMGNIYMDLFQRPTKSKSNCTFPLRQSSMHSDYASVVLSLQLEADFSLLVFLTYLNPSPFLLSMHELETLFHEFGHALHGVLSRVRFQHVSGSRVPMDFMETPSQFMENFCYSYPVLSMFAKHHITGETIPVEMVEELRKWKLNMAATSIQQDICRAMVDVHLHSKLNPNNPAETTSNIVKSLHEKYSFVTYPTHCNSHGKFDHLLGYGASYYSYLYSKLYSANIWNKCFLHDPLSKESGLKVKRELLQKGGSRKPNEILYALTGTSRLDEKLILPFATE